MQSKVFCRGVFCKRWNRNKNCKECGIRVCGVCNISSMQNGKVYCPDCYLDTFSPDWDKLNKEFENMIKNIMR